MKYKEFRGDLRMWEEKLLIFSLVPVYKYTLFLKPTKYSIFIRKRRKKSVYYLKPSKESIEGNYMNITKKI